MLLSSSKNSLIPIFLIELSSPMRTREQTEFRDTEEASSSGRHHTLDSVTPYGTIFSHMNFASPLPGSRLPEGKYHSAGEIEGLYHKVQNNYVLLSKDFYLVIMNGFFYGTIINGYIRPIYNQNGQQVVVSQRTNRKYVISKDQAAVMGFNQHFTQHTWNHS